MHYRLTRKLCWLASYQYQCCDIIQLILLYMYRFYRLLLHGICQYMGLHSSSKLRLINFSVCWSLLKHHCDLLSCMIVRLLLLLCPSSIVLAYKVPYNNSSILIEIEWALHHRCVTLTEHYDIICSHTPEPTPGPFQ